MLYPTLWGIGLSFREMRLNRLDLGTGFVGLKHYQAMIDDPVFWLSLRNTAIWTTGAVIGELALGLCAALLLNRDLPGFRAASVLILLPWFLPNVVAGHMWALMLDPRLGVINDLLVKVGVLDELQGLVRRSRHGAGGGAGGRDLARLPVLRAPAARRPQGDPAGPLRGGGGRRRGPVSSSAS